MKPGEAMEILGLVGTSLEELRPEDVVRAFRRAALANHPDTATAGVSQGESKMSRFDMDLLTKAKKTLLSDTKQANYACAQCRGVGTIRYKFGVRPCGACKGKGERYGRG